MSACNVSILSIRSLLKRILRKLILKMPNFLRKKQISIADKKAEESPNKSIEESERLNKDLEERPKELQKTQNVQAAAYIEQPSCSSKPEAQETLAKNEVYNINELYYMVSLPQNPNELELIPITRVRGFLYKYPFTEEMQNEKREFTFNQLAAELKNLKLPNPNWKITAELKNSKISSFTFTNFLKVGERSVTFNSDIQEYKIIIEDRPAELLGSPGKVENIRDVEILLDIVETIDRNDIMIEYKTPL